MKILPKLDHTLEKMKENNYSEYFKFKQSLEMLKFYYASKEKSINTFDDFQQKSGHLKKDI